MFGRDTGLVDDGAPFAMVATATRAATPTQQKRWKAFTGETDLNRVGSSEACGRLELAAEVKHARKINAMRGDEEAGGHTANPRSSGEQRLSVRRQIKCQSLSYMSTGKPLKDEGTDLPMIPVRITARYLATRGPCPRP